MTCLVSCGHEVDRLRSPDINVMLVTIDTLRGDHLGSYGYPRDATPNIDEIATRGIAFLEAFSQRGLTFPSVSSIMTAKYVYSHGVISMYKTALPDSQRTLAEVMRDLGYQTAGFTSHLALNRSVGFAQGFDEYFQFHARDEEKMALKVAEWLQTNRGRKFFLWVHSFGPHSPYQAPPPWNDKFTKPDYEGPYDGSQKQLYDIAREQKLSPEDKFHIVALYDGKLARVDDLIGRMVRKLDSLGLRDRTLVIVTSDHGEELFDHFLYFSHEASVYDGVLRIPLILSLPGRFPQGRMIRGKVVESVDIMPTILDVVGGDPEEQMQGRSLLPLIAGVDEAGHEYAHGTIDSIKKSMSILTIRSPRWRYIYNPDGYVPGANLFYGEEELYDIRRDPGEQVNVVEQHPAVATELRRELLRWKAWTEEHRVAAQTEGDAEVEARLRALGYVEEDAEDIEAHGGGGGTLEEDLSVENTE